MTEETVRKLPQILRKFVGTLKTTSFDESRGSYMCDSSLKVINFDKLPREYSRGKGWRFVPNSNDALYIGVDGSWYFIEFKNGRIEKENIYRKLYDSIIMAVELRLIPDLNFSREKIKYILVYNSEKYSKSQESESRTENYSYFLKLAQEEEKLFDIEKFEGYLLKETHTYTQNRFYEKFVVPMEKQENIAAV